jgi:peptidoglycan/LPS O-acetylase OafA/YrhL
VDSKQPKIAGIDQLRGLAALAVVVCHLAGQFYGWERSSPGPERIFGWLGQWGVALFFVISGFCIRLPMARARSADPHARLEIHQYLTHRFLRIAPPYWAAIAISAAVGLLVTTAQITGAHGGVDVALHVLALHTLTPASFYSINGVLWTIALEAHFYAAYILLANRRTSLRMLVVLLGVGLVVYGLVSKLLPTPNPWRLVGQELFITSFWQWYLGALLADSFVRRRPVMPTSVLLMTRVVAVTVGLGLGLVDPVLWQLHLTYWAVPVAAAWTVWSFVTRPLTSTATSRLAAGLSFTGRVSYSLYLLHPAVLALLVFATAGLALPAWGSATLGLAGSLVAAWLGYRLIERPFLAWKMRQGSTVEPSHRDTLIDATT